MMIPQGPMCVAMTHMDHHLLLMRFLCIIHNNIIKTMNMIDIRSKRRNYALKWDGERKPTWLWIVYSSFPVLNTTTYKPSTAPQTKEMKAVKNKFECIIYDVNDLELMDPDVTRLRLVMNEDGIGSDDDDDDWQQSNEDALCLFTSSLMGSVYSRHAPCALSVPMKHYICHNEYNMTHAMCKRLHDRWKVKIPQEEQDALRQELLKEWNCDAAVVTSYTLIKEEEEEEENEDDEMEEDVIVDDEIAKHDYNGSVTDWNAIRALGMTIPSYYLDPSKYTAEQLADPGCFKEKKVICDPRNPEREIEINLFIYIPGGDILGQLKAQSGTYPPAVYEIGCADGKRMCMLCGGKEKECVGIIDLLNDARDRIWACQECKSVFRIGLKLNTRTKQYRVKDHMNDAAAAAAEVSMVQTTSTSNNNNNQKNECEKKKKKKKKKKKLKAKKNTKEGRFCDTVRAFEPFVYDVRDTQYVFRYFCETDLDVLNHLDMKMTAQLLGTDADSYGRVWLNKLTNPKRKTHHIWRTITCAQLLAVDDDESVQQKKLHMVPSSTGYVERMESKPIAFAMYKHMKNDQNMSKRYGELFWILVDNGHQRKGIASRLIDIMVNEAQREEKISEFRLHVLKENDAAIPLYKKLAFTKKGSKQNYPKRDYESYRCVKML
eukprot:807609_1